MGEQLNVATVMEGSVRKAGNRLRITAQLINVADGYHLWSERYDRELEDVFAVQDEIAASIVKALRVVLTDEEKRAIERPHTRERGGLRVLPPRPAVLLSVPREGAAVRPPDVQPGHRDRPRLRPRLRRASPTAARSSTSTGTPAPPTSSRRSPRAGRLSELAPDLAEAHAARGFALTLGGNHEEANREFETAIRLDPKLYEGYLYYANGRFAEGQAGGGGEALRAGGGRAHRGLSGPGAGRPLLCRARAREAESRGAYERGLRAAERHIELNPDDPRAHYLGAVAWCRLGQVEKGLEWGDGRWRSTRRMPACSTTWPASTQWPAGGTGRSTWSAPSERLRPSRMDRARPRFQRCPRPPPVRDHPAASLTPPT